MIRFVRRWWPKLYGLGFMSALTYLMVAAHSINTELWLLVVRPVSWGLHATLPATFLQAFGIVALLGVLSALLRRIDRKFDPNRIVHANVNFRLLLHRYWRWPFIVLLVWNLPVLATLEEFIFRHGMSQWPTVTWQDVMLRSIGFGAFHALMSWNWRGGIMQTMLGFWFSYQYLSGVVDPLFTASTSHFLVDLIALIPAFLALVLQRPIETPPTPACS